MKSFVRESTRSASLITQSVVGVRLYYMQSVAKLLNKDQMNNFVAVDQLLMNQLRTTMSRRAVFSSADASIVISSDLCVSANTSSFISKVPCLTAERYTMEIWD